MVIHKKILFGITFFLIFSLVLPINAEIESPKKQMKRGTLAVDVICKENLELVIRTNTTPNSIFFWFINSDEFSFFILNRLGTNHHLSSNTQHLII